MSSSSLAPEAEGTIPFTRNGETFSTYYKVFGDLNTPKRTPLIVLHGGPGLSHDYLLPISDLSISMPVIFYDQIGNARSTHLKDKDPSFWTIDLFLDEFENLVRHFGLESGYDILGHSWGGMMACELIVRRHPSGLRHFVISSSPASVSLWMASTARLLEGCPKEVQEGFKMHETDPDKFKWAMGEFEPKHICRAIPFPSDIRVSLAYSQGEDGDSTVSDSGYVRPFVPCEVLM
jgi:proline-specific peptidase